MTFDNVCTECLEKKNIFWWDYLYKCDDSKVSGLKKLCYGCLVLIGWKEVIEKNKPNTFSCIRCSSKFLKNNWKSDICPLCFFASRRKNE